MEGSGGCSEGPECSIQSQKKKELLLIKGKMVKCHCPKTLKILTTKKKKYIFEVNLFYRG